MLDFRIDSFLAVCKYMNFTKASEELNITQPAVSQHIHYLEREYQTKLFEYKGKKLFLTPSGKLLLNAATTMKHDEIFLRKNMRQQHGEARHMVLGATLTIGEFMMPQLLSRYLQKYPTVSIDLQIANTQQLLEKIDRGEIDFALVEGYFDKREYDSRMFSKENYIAVCSPKYPFSDKEQSLEPVSYTHLGESQMISCYNTGKVTAGFGTTGSYIGGIIGEHSSVKSSIHNCYWVTDGENGITQGKGVQRE